MTGKTSIEWTHMPGFAGDVWNPTVGCTRVSAGCDNCYAFTLHDQRHAANLRVAKRESGTLKMSPLGLRVDHPELVGVKGGLSRSPQYDLPFSRVQLLEDRLDAPLRKRKPTCYFVDSMADLFHEDVPDEFLVRAFLTMSLATWHRFLILTKRPARMREFLSSDALTRSSEVSLEWARTHLRYIDGMDLGRIMAGQQPYILPAPNVWLGTSVEDQRAADERIPHLLATPAAVRFLSCEPLLGPVGLDGSVSYYDGHHAIGNVLRRSVRMDAPITPRIDWVIVGGESGPRARPMDLAWARSLRDQCRAAGVAFFMKQLGSKPVKDFMPYPADDGCPTREAHDHPVRVRESHGRDMSEWPEDLRVREWPR